MTTRLRSCDLFAGVGGASLAAARAGFEPAFASEIDRRAADTYAANFGHRPAGDVARVDPARVPAHDLCLVGLPCVGFSSLGKGRGFADPREHAWLSALGVVAAVRPRAVVVENVPRLATHDRGRSLGLVAGSLRLLGYRVTWRVLDATSFGGAQVRRRLFVVASRGRGFDFGRLATTPGGCVRDVLDPAAGGPYLDPASYTLLPEPHRTPSGPVFVGHRPAPPWQEGGRADRPHTHRHPYRIYGTGGPAPTLTAFGSASQLWVMTERGVRRLSFRERARLMGLPDDFAWPRPANHLLGNSVHVPTVTELARQIREQLF